MPRVHHVDARAAVDAHDGAGIAPREKVLVANVGAGTVSVLNG
jgi:hypothetical protein